MNEVIPDKEVMIISGRKTQTIQGNRNVNDDLGVNVKVKREALYGET